MAVPTQPPPPQEPLRTPPQEPPQEPTIFQKARAAPITFGIVALNVAAFLWAEQHGGTTHVQTLMRYGAVEPLHVWAGEYWRVATSMFMHAGWIHILMNMYVLIGWGPPVERALGMKRFALLYLLAGLASGCASVVGGILFRPHASVGASGALFGIIGAVLALRRRQLPSFEAFFADKAIRSTLLQIGLLTVIGSVALNLDNSAHFGGFAAGFAICWLYTSPPPRHGWLAFAAALGALFVFAARPWWTPPRDEARRLVHYANAYIRGETIDDGRRVPWPQNVARGERLLEKGCASGVAAVCMVLAAHVEESGAPGAADRARALVNRATQLDPGVDPGVETPTP